MRANSVRSLLFVASLVLPTAACIDSVGAVTAHAKGHGTVRIYDGSFDDLWKAAHFVLREDELGTPEDHPAEGYVVTNHPSSEAPSSLDQVGIWVEPVEPGKTRVSVVVMSGTEPTAGIVGPDEQDVQKHIAKALALVQAGQPVPDGLR